ncbi:unnamed protein product [Ceutorhynchus assimilis]|uniref:Craniofacial development protein 2 n=1 Tax=Ceutorhynchus assimilis TaxID=467358 RepID=A0A9N9N065_9CUCU|nr:unnamed protein product [Ceutorhynchus assimilis]
MNSRETEESECYQPEEEIAEKMSFVFRELKMKAKVLNGVLDEQDNNLPAVETNPSIASEQDGFNVDDTSEDKENETEQTQKANKAGILELSVYAPDTGKPVQETIDFYEQLQLLIETIPQHEDIIIMGDLNGIVGNEVIPEVKNRFNEEIVNERAINKNNGSWKRFLDLDSSSNEMICCMGELQRRMVSDKA